MAEMLTKSDRRVDGLRETCDGIGVASPWFWASSCQFQTIMIAAVDSDFPKGNEDELVVSGVIGRQNSRQ
jgi:hypothetical protein